MTKTYEPRLLAKYRDKTRAKMKEQFSYTNDMQIPKITKIVINMGVGEAVGDSKKNQRRARRHGINCRAKTCWHKS